MPLADHTLRSASVAIQHCKSAYYHGDTERGREGVRTEGGRERGREGVRTEGERERDGKVIVQCNRVSYGFKMPALFNTSTATELRDVIERNLRLNFPTVCHFFKQSE